MCNQNLKSYKNMTDLERETLASKFRKKPDAKHKVIFCRETRSLILAANYKTPLRSTQKAIQFMKNIYSPSELSVVAMPRMVA